MYVKVDFCRFMVATFSIAVCHQTDWFLASPFWVTFSLMAALHTGFPEHRQVVMALQIPGAHMRRAGHPVSVRDPFISQLLLLGKQLPSHQTEFERRKLRMWDWDLLCALGWNLSLKSQECCCEFSEGGSPSRDTCRALPLSGASSTAVLADKCPQHWTESWNSKPPLYQLECCKILFQFLLNFLPLLGPLRHPSALSFQTGGCSSL